MIENYSEWLEKYEISLNEEKKKKLEEFAKEVLHWNRKINLTAAKNLKEIIERHLLDSLIHLTLHIGKENNIVDLGSGGGFPAIPLAIVLDNTDFLLVEKVPKKCAFLNRIKRTLKLNNIKVENTLLENMEQPLPEALITRAVKINQKLTKNVKVRGVKRIYMFETQKPENATMTKEYVLPGEKKLRYATMKEIK